MPPYHYLTANCMWLQSGLWVTMCNMHLHEVVTLNSYVTLIPPHGTELGSPGVRNFVFLLDHFRFSNTLETPAHAWRSAGMSVQKHDVMKRMKILRSNFHFLVGQRTTKSAEILFISWTKSARTAKQRLVLLVTALITNVTLLTAAAMVDSLADTNVC